MSKLDDYIPFTVIENVHFPTLPLTSVAWIETLVLPILNFISLWSTGMLDIAGGMPELSESTLLIRFIKTNTYYPVWWKTMVISNGPQDKA